MSLSEYKLLVKNTRYLFSSSFVLLSSTWLYCLQWMEREMAGLSLLLLLGFQGLMYLTTVWSVRIRAWYSCRQVKTIKEAEYILVIPAKHQGSGELLALSKAKDEVFFIFQKKKYIWDADLGDFRGLEFPGDKPTTFMEFKGFLGIKGETEMRKVRGKYGYNR